MFRLLNFLVINCEPCLGKVLHTYITTTKLTGKQRQSGQHTLGVDAKPSGQVLIVPLSDPKITDLSPRQPPFN